MKKLLFLLCFLFLTSCFVKKEKNEHNEDMAIFLKELKTPRAEQLITVSPQGYNLPLAVEKAICDKNEFCSNYLYIQALYRKGLDQYLLEKLDLKKYDDLLVNNSLRFITIPKERQNVYQETSTIPLHYIYLHNNIYIERLNRSTLDFLQSRIAHQKLNVDAELMQVIKETYLKVIAVFPEEKSPTKVLYSTDGKKTAWNNAVIFEIGHLSEFDEKGNYVSRENEIRKDNYLKKELIPQLENEMSAKLNCPVTIFIEK